MNNVDAPDIPEGFVNIGTGEDFTIKRNVDFKGKVNWDISKPNGTPRKILDVSRILNFGWKAKTSLEDGISKVYKWFLNVDSYSPKV